MLKRLLITSISALGAWAGAAHAAPTILYQPGNAGSMVPPGTTVIENFDEYADGASIGTNSYAYAMYGAIGFRPSYGSTGNFAAVGQGGNYTISFGDGTSILAFVLGSLDGYNSLTLTFSDGSTPLTLTGQQIIAGPASSSMVPDNGQMDNSATNGVVSYFTDSTQLITSATFTSQYNSFELDNIAIAVPEPAAWGMMILGFGLVGGVLRRRSSAKVSFA